MERKEVILLLNRYKAGTCSEEEQALLESWYLQHDVNAIAEITAEELNQDLLLMRHGLPLQQQVRPRFRTWPFIGVAAAVLLVVGVGLVFFIGNGNFKNPFGGPAYANDVPPGKNTAILTLANGKTIGLSDAKSGIVIDASKLAYNDGSSISIPNEDKTVEMTMRTPAGGTYQVILPDGSKVWLNSGSSLKFPQVFRGGERRVELTGEAYFEVAKNKEHPFIVKSPNQQVTVLGTHFNISAYENDNLTRTTLLEGAVRVVLDDLQKRNDDSGYTVLSPGEQAVSNGRNLDVKNADLDEAVSWKNGYFRFNDEKLNSVMQKIARWYNIEVIYKDKPTEEGFTGTISRASNISEVLSMLERTKTVRFEIEGRRVMVMN
ncbi:FecR family protein [Pedobacter africanus]|uniref:FecR family protein n=1 Tax=Pedobacter africanus TaxID=151894 RepID=A0A1W2A7I7_9SPHI|nr:FecR family protein [Pedobacter africanus]SMC56617.1 FecR family protein [Pedobacter africanus]